MNKNENIEATSTEDVEGHGFKKPIEHELDDVSGHGARPTHLVADEDAERHGFQVNV